MSIFCGILLSFIALQNIDVDKFNFSTDTPTENVVNTTVQEFHPLVKTAFNEAEKKFLDVEIDEPEGMHPDADKCICKGTGVIVHGDGHRTSCDYHGKREEPKATATCPCGPDCPCGENCECGEDCQCVKVTEKHQAALKDFKAKDVVEAPKAQPAAAPIKTVSQEQVTVSKRVTRKDRPRNSVEKTHYQLIIFSAKWCMACVAMKNAIVPGLKSAGIIVSDKPDADVRIIDIDENRLFYDQMRNNERTIPLVIEIRDNVIVSRKHGAQSLTQLFKNYDLEN